MSTRYDLLSEDAISLLSVACARLDLASAYSRADKWARPSARQSVSRLGSGAIAEAFLVAVPDGNAFVIKARRPGIDLILKSDIFILNALTAVASRCGLFKSLNLVANARLLTDLLGLQLDFSAERRNLKAFRSNLAGHAQVPRVYAMGKDDCIYMEYLKRRIDLTQADPKACKRFAVDLMRLIYRMVFVDGLVHCDLHTGNIYVGENGDLVVVDVGFCSVIDDDVRWDFREFFLAIGLKRPEVLARIILRYSAGNVASNAEHSIKLQCVDLVEKHSGLTAGEFRLISLIKDLYRIYNSHGLSMTSDLFSIIYALLVVEGVVMKLDPDLDFQALAFEFMVENRNEIFMRRNSRAVRLSWSADTVGHAAYPGPQAEVGQAGVG